MSRVQPATRLVLLSEHADNKQNKRDFGQGERLVSPEYRIANGFLDLLAENYESMKLNVIDWQFTYASSLGVKMSDCEQKRLKERALYIFAKVLNDRGLSRDEQVWLVHACGARLVHNFTVSGTDLLL